MILYKKHSGLTITIYRYRQKRKNDVKTTHYSPGKKEDISIPFSPGILLVSEMEEKDQQV
jgi:hypothetical protein